MFATTRLTHDAEPDTGSSRASHEPASGDAEVGAPFEVAIDSTELLKGQKSVAIAHNGSVYRLQATKLGKLILTK